MVWESCQISQRPVPWWLEILEWSERQCLVNRHASAKFYYIVSVSQFVEMIFKPCHTRAASSQCFHSVKKSCRSLRCALCSRQQHCVNVVKTLCNRLERHAAAFILNMLKTNAAAGRLHSMLDRACCEDVVGSSRASWAHRKHAWRRHVNSVLDSAFGMHFDFVRMLCTRYNWQIDILRRISLRPDSPLTCFQNAVQTLWHRRLGWQALFLSFICFV